MNIIQQKKEREKQSQFNYEYLLRFGLKQTLFRLGILKFCRPHFSLLFSVVISKFP